MEESHVIVEGHMVWWDGDVISLLICPSGFVTPCACDTSTQNFGNLSTPQDVRDFWFS